MRELRVKNVIAMCHIITYYKDFIKDVKKQMQERKNFSILDFTEDLNKVSKNQSVMGKRKAKKFYKKYQGVINTINRHSRIDTFLIEHIFGKAEKGDLDETIHTFYEYLYNNQNSIEQILILLEQIKALGFQYIELDETADFTKEEYSISPVPIENFAENTAYLENLERIPAYGKKIKYKSNGSSYKILFDYCVICSCFSADTTIYVNNLLFEPSVLPTFPCSYEDLFDEIVSLKEEKTEECATITDTIDIKLTLNDLRKELTSAKQTFENLSNSFEKSNLEEALLYMELELARMEQIDKEHDKTVVSSSINEEDLKREINLYISGHKNK